jgi:hypothetical protein
MSRNSNIVDGDGSGKYIKVNDAGYILTQNSIIPPNDSRDLQIIYRKFLTLNADDTTTEMLVDGSTTPQKFYVEASSENDIYITSLSIIIQGALLDLGVDFAGSGSALGNGFNVYYEDQNGLINIGTDLTTNFDFIRLCQGNPNFGDDGNAFIIPGLTAGKKKDAATGIIPILDFNEVFGFTYGLKLLRGSNNRLVLEVNDDLTTGLGLNSGMNVIAYGFERKPN